MFVAAMWNCSAMVYRFLERIGGINNYCVAQKLLVKVAPYIHLFGGLGWWTPQARSDNAEVAACPDSAARLCSFNSWSMCLPIFSAASTCMGLNWYSTPDSSFSGAQSFGLVRIKLPECCVWLERDPDTYSYWSEDASHCPRHTPRTHYVG